MTDIDQGTDLDLDEGARARGKGGMKLYAMILAGVLLLAGSGGAAWYFLLGNREAPAEARKTEAPLPYLFEMKPFVVTMAGRNGPSRFVQLGLNLQLTSAAAGELITAVLPQVQDSARQSALVFKAEDLQSPEGVDKVRAAMVAGVNKALARDLGAERLDRFTPKGSEGPVLNIYFSQLIVE